VEGLCEASGVPPGSYVSLGSNIFNSGASCPVTASDSTPFGYGTSLWNAVPSLIAAALPFYDNAGVASSIDNGTCASGVTEDQTGAARPTGAGLCDAGSFEQ